MNKKYVMAFLFVSGLIVTLFLRLGDRDRRKVSPFINDGVTQPVPADDPVHDPIILKDKKKKFKEKNEKVDDDLSYQERRINKIEILWGKIMQNKFDDLNLSPEKFQKYQIMREEFEQQALAEFQDFHEKMNETRGENYKYRLTEFDDQVMNKLRKEYNEKLAKVVGEEAIREIVKTRDEFNEKIKRRTSNPEDDVIIDF